jgi:hypothetical protein
MVADVDLEDIKRLEKKTWCGRVRWTEDEA